MSFAALTSTFRGKPCQDQWLQLEEQKLLDCPSLFLELAKALQEKTYKNRIL